MKHEIEEWEYHRILNNPYLYYFSTALKKHFEWCAAVGKARTLTFSDALGQTQSVSGGPQGESVSPAQPNDLDEFPELLGVIVFASCIQKNAVRLYV
jgi:hypothetical protein